MSVYEGSSRTSSDPMGSFSPGLLLVMALILIDSASKFGAPCFPLTEIVLGRLSDRAPCPGDLKRFSLTDKEPGPVALSEA